MADKILRIIFNGISTLVPGAPRNGDPPPKKAFVLMAANRKERKNDWNATMDRHFPFVHVSESLIEKPIPPPETWVDDEKLGRFNIYFLDNARVTIDQSPSSGLDYYIDRKHGLGERPGSDDVASEHDIRWLADMRDILPAHSRLKSTTNPAAASVGPEVAAVVELDGGMIKASFPCKSVQPKTFMDAQRRIVPGLNRVLASEFFIDMSYPEETEKVTLRLTALREGASATGIDGNALVLRWPDKGDGTIVVRMGNDTQRETLLLTSVKRCDARTRGTTNEPVLIPRDDDFFLHYDILDVPDDAGRPLPQNGPHQTEFDGCKPSNTGGPPP